MKTKNKGFTLIELLAVIVVLAIIALIAVPIILNLIEKSRKGSAVDSAYGLRKSTQLYYSGGLISSPTGIEEIEFNCDGENCISDKKDLNGEFIKLDIDGTIPTSGKITVNSNGEMNFENIIYYNKYECIIGQSGPITCDGMKTKYITINTDINGWAQSKKVTLKYDKSCSNNEYSIDGGTTWTSYTNEIDITQNTEIKAKSTCDGNIVEEIFNINKIDTTAPVLNAIDPFSVTKLSSSSVQIVVNEVYEDGEIYGYAYSIDNGLNYSEIQKNSVMIVNNLTPGETYNVKVKVYNATYGTVGAEDDKAITESEEAKKVTLEKMELIIKVNPEGEVWAIEKIVTIEGYPEGYEHKYSDDGGTTWKDYTGPISVKENNTTITGCAFDGKVAVTNSPSVIVNNIDNEAPVITGVTYTKEDGSIYTANEWTNGNVTATIEGNDGTGSGIKTYQITYDNGSTWNDISHPIIIDKTSTIQIKVIDGVNKESNVTDSITINIDKVAPILTVDEEQIVVTEDTITIPYTVDDENATVTCEYGLDETYGSVGTIENGTCIISELNDGTEYFFKLVAMDQTGNFDEYAGKMTTEKSSYITGEAITLGDYNWHVIGQYQDSEDRTLVTLLMDAGQVSNMAHCTDDELDTTDCGTSGGYLVYSWDKSKIRTYLNGEFLTDLESKITNEIVETEICADPSKKGTTYGGYLMTEVNAITDASCTTIVNDKVRLISMSEYYNMSPYYSGTDDAYPNVENITKLSSASNYGSWLYSTSVGKWWTMDAHYVSSGSATGTIRKGVYIMTSGQPYPTFSYSNSIIRPVITIVKE